MDGRARRHHHARVRVLTHIKKLDDCFGQFLVRVSCVCGAVREIEPEALARLLGWKVTLKELALRMRCSRCGKKAAQVVAVARPRPRGIPKNPH
jgi:bacterioferritin-associated ferredoxin